jgi:hypothetical protein
MRTQALRVTAGVYENGDWHVTLIRDIYTRGVLINSELLVGPIYCHWNRVEAETLRCLDLLRDFELEHLDVTAAG